MGIHLRCSADGVDGNSLEGIRHSNVSPAKFLFSAKGYHLYDQDFPGHTRRNLERLEMRHAQTAHQHGRRMGLHERGPCRWCVGGVKPVHQHSELRENPCTASLGGPPLPCSLLHSLHPYRVMPHLHSNCSENCNMKSPFHKNFSGLLRWCNTI